MWRLLSIIVAWLALTRKRDAWRAGGRFKNVHELYNLRALKISILYKNNIFQCMGKVFCVEFQRVPLKFHTKYLTHTFQCMTLNIFKDCHWGYSNLKIYSRIKFCCGHIYQWYKKQWEVPIAMYVGYKISRSHSPEEFFIALAIRLLLKSNTDIERCWFYSQVKIYELLDLRAHKCFWNAPLVFDIAWCCQPHRNVIQTAP